MALGACKLHCNVVCSGLPLSQRFAERCRCLHRCGPELVRSSRAGAWRRMTIISVHYKSEQALSRPHSSAIDCVPSRTAHVIIDPSSRGAPHTLLSAGWVPLLHDLIVRTPTLATRASAAQLHTRLLSAAAHRLTRVRCAPMMEKGLRYSARHPPCTQIVATPYRRRRDVRRIRWSRGWRAPSAPRTWQARR